MDHGTLEGDDPGAAGSQGDIGIDAVIGIEIDVIGLHGMDLFAFIQLEKLRHAGAQGQECGIARVDGGFELRMVGQQAFEQFVTQTNRPCLATNGTHLMQLHQKSIHCTLLKTQGPRHHRRGPAGLSP